MNLPIIAEVDGEPIGLAWGRIDTSDPDVAVLYQMWVAPSHRGAGAGRRLVETVIAWARVRNVSSVDLGVTCGDSPARRLYERVWVPKTLAGDFRKFWPVPVMVAPRRV